MPISPTIGAVRLAGMKRTHLARLDRNTWVRRHKSDPPVLIAYTVVRAHCGTRLGGRRTVEQLPPGTVVTCPVCVGHV